MALPVSSLTGRETRSHSVSRVNAGVRTLALSAVLAVAVAAGCQYPRDPDGTLNRVDGGVMRVGVSESDPWVVMEGDEPSGGAEVELARSFARDVGARIEWVQGSEEELVDAAKEGQVDLILAGLTNKSRWKKDVAFTRPYVETRTVVGAPGGRSYPDDFEGVPVAVELGSDEEGMLEQRTDARVTPVTDLASRRGEPAAVHDYLLDDLGLTDTGTELDKSKHVMAVKLGENAFLVRLERFLLNREDEIRQLLTREGRP
jgi:polar amino acid transport system substrate-binding protein